MEKWSPVKGYERRYSVSNYGHVKSHRNTGDLILRDCPDSIGYHIVVFCVSGVRRSKKVHQLVAQHFLGDCPPGKQVNHINGCKSDNRECNLEYVTVCENIGHAKRLGLNARGESCALSKLTEKNIRDIRASRKRNIELADMLGVTAGTIGRIRKRLTWKHVR